MGNLGIWDNFKSISMVVAILGISLTMITGMTVVYADDDWDDDDRHERDYDDDDRHESDDDDDDKKQISLKDLGILQLAAHDLFNVDRIIEFDFENGKLDLSTLFEDTKTGLDFEPEDIAKGGEIRNRENVILFTVASKIGEKYLDFIDEGMSEKKAKKKTIKLYHKLLKKTFEKTFDEKFPKKRGGEVTMTENLAFRTIHDFLPGEIIFNGVPTPVLSIPPQTALSKSELKQLSSELDGKFDEEFLNIVISHPDGPTITVNLLEADSNFADQFNTKFSFEFFLEELQDGSYDKKDKVMKQIRKLFGKGLNF